MNEPWKLAWGWRMRSRRRPVVEVGLPCLALMVALHPAIARAGACSVRQAIVDIRVVESPLAIRTDFTASDLAAMAARLAQSPPHPVLGFYQGSVGYRVQVDAPGPPSACGAIRIRAELVATDRHLEIARDLRERPAQFRAALVHYRHHAVAASVALEEVAARVRGRLESEIAAYLAWKPPCSAHDLAGLEKHVGGLLDHAVTTYTASLGKVQARVDTPEEISALASAGSRI